METINIDPGDFKEFINKIEESQKGLEKVAQESPDVKEGKTRVEEEMKEPGYILYNGIAETVKRIMNSEEFINTIKESGIVYVPDPHIKEVILHNFKTMLAAMTFVVTQACYQSIEFYDELLKEEIDKNLQSICDGMNILKANDDGMYAVIQALQRKVGMLEKEIGYLKLNMRNK